MVNINKGITIRNEIINFKLEDIKKNEQLDVFDIINNESNNKQNSLKTEVKKININSIVTEKFINEFWTSKQRQSNSIHEISYRACFKAQLPGFFIKKLTDKGDYVYDPFLGRGTTVIEAALLNRKIIGNDINPLSKVLSEPRLLIPNIAKLTKYLNDIPIDYSLKSDIDLSMFYHQKTESELVSIKKYIFKKTEQNSYDKWIMAVATNRLTGHSKGFFSVYTMPPNQAVTAKRQIKINEKRKQAPEYRDVKKLIIKKSISLIRDISLSQRKQLKIIHSTSSFYNCDARETKEIPNNFVQLTVTSPPFLDVIQYAKDNWLRCWFNGIDVKEIEQKITMSKTVDQWSTVMQDVFNELYRITRIGGFVAFEVGEVRNGKVNLEDHVAPLGVNSGFDLIGILINQQEFTKTSNIWGVSNNKSGTNSNRIVIFYKSK